MIVQDNPEQQRFELVDGDEVVGIADYRRQGDTLVIPHTEIQRHRRGQGLGEVLVQGALDATRAQGLRVEARCWFVEQFIATHPDYADLAVSAFDRT